MKDNQWLAKVNAHGYDDDMPEDEYPESADLRGRSLMGACVPGASFFYSTKSATGIARSGTRLI